MTASIDAAWVVEQMIEEGKEKNEIISFLSQNFPDKDPEEMYTACVWVCERKRMEEERLEAEALI